MEWVSACACSEVSGEVVSEAGGAPWFRGWIRDSGCVFGSLAAGPGEPSAARTGACKYTGLLGFIGGAAYGAGAFRYATWVAPCPSVACSY